MDVITLLAQSCNVHKGTPNLFQRKSSPCFEGFLSSLDLMMQQHILDVPLWTILDAILICKIAIKSPET